MTPPQRRRDHREEAEKKTENQYPSAFQSQSSKITRIFDDCKWGQMTNISVFSLRTPRLSGETIEHGFPPYFAPKIVPKMGSTINQLNRFVLKSTNPLYKFAIGLTNPLCKFAIELMNLLSEYVERLMKLLNKYVERLMKQFHLYIKN